MRRNEPSLEEGLADYYYDQLWAMFDDDDDFDSVMYRWFYDENWEWWLEQVDYDAVSEVLGEDYLY